MREGWGRIRWKMWDDFVDGITLSGYYVCGTGNSASPKGSDGLTRRKP